MEYIGVITGNVEDLKKRYQIKSDSMFGCSVFHDKRRKSIKVEVCSLTLLWEKSRVSKKEFKKINIDVNKPVDKSRWVKPDEESIINELIVQLVSRHIFEEKSEEWIIATAKADVLYAIINSEAPSNPQVLCSYAWHSNIETLYSVLGNKTKAGHLWKMISTDLKAKKYDQKKAIKRRKEWIKNEWKKIITVSHKKPKAKW